MQYLKNVATLELNRDKCTGCHLCTIVCPHNVFLITEKKAEIINKDSCMECGACAKNCEAKAISVQAGVGCASGIIQGALTGTEPTCGCSDSGGCC